MATQKVVAQSYPNVVFERDPYREMTQPNTKHVSGILAQIEYEELTLGTQE